MPKLGLIFELRRAEAPAGQDLLVAGSVPELGCWDPRAASDRKRSLVTSSQPPWTGPLGDPCRSTPAPVWLEFAGEEPEAEDGSCCSSSQGSTPGSRTLEISYKYIKGCGRSYAWEDSIPNRRARVLRQPGVVWLISDAAWDTQGPGHITPLMRSEVLSRSLRLDPELAPSELGMDDVQSFCLSPTAGQSAQGMSSFFQPEQESATDEVLALRGEVAHMRHAAAELGAGQGVQAVGIPKDEVQSLQQEIRGLKDMAVEFRKRQGAQASSQDGVQSLREVVLQLRDAAAELPKSWEKSAGDELRTLWEEVLQLGSAAAELRKSQEESAADEARRSQQAQARAEDEARSLREEVSRLKGMADEARRSQQAQARAEDEARSLREAVSRLQGMADEARRSQQAQARAEDEARSLREEVSQLRCSSAELLKSQEELRSRNKILQEKLAKCLAQLEPAAEEMPQKNSLPPKEMMEQVGRRHTTWTEGSVADEAPGHVGRFPSLPLLPISSPRKAQGCTPRGAENELMATLRQRREKLEPATL